MATIHGIRSYEGIRDRASTVEVAGVALRVASLVDIIKSKRAAGRPRDLAVLELLETALEEPVSRRVRLAAVARESRRNLIEMIRRWQALPPHKRTHFLRKRVRPGGSAL
jgi:hypothetical protein